MGSSKASAVVAMFCVACAPAPVPAVVAPTAPAAASAADSTPATSAGAAPAAASAPIAPSDVLASNRSAFDACYAQARAKDPALGRTTVGMTFAINADGRPQTVDLKYRNRMDEGAKECMRDAALSLHFPMSMEGTQTATIVFAPPAPSAP
jgi:hypothetical protein